MAKKQKIKIEAEITLPNLCDDSEHEDLTSAAEAVADEIGGWLESALEERAEEEAYTKCEDLFVSAWVEDSDEEQE